jgi:hypothetical protein
MSDDMRSLLASAMEGKQQDLPVTQPEEPTEEAPVEPTEVPPEEPEEDVPEGWEASVYRGLPEPARKLVGDREKAFRERAQAAEFHSRLSKMLEPYRQRISVGGVDEIGAIQYLFQAQAALDQNPVEGLKHLARIYGVDLAKLSEAVAEQAPAVPDEVGARLQAIEKYVASQAQQEQNRTQAQVTSAVKRLWEDGKHPEITLVAPRMPVIIRALVQERPDADYGAILEEAYGVAVEMVPEARKAREGRAAVAAKDTATAKRKDVSARGTPGAAMAKSKGGGIREILSDALEGLD